MADTFGTRAQVTLSLDDLDALRGQLGESNNQIVRLERKIEQLKAFDPSGQVPDLCETIRAAIKVVQFAVGNLEPSTVRGWPHEALVQFSEGIERIPIPDEDVSVKTIIHEMARDLRHFAKTAAQYEEYRKQRAAVAIQATGADFGPQTEDAMAAHKARSTAIEQAPNEDQVEGNQIGR